MSTTQVELESMLREAVHKAKEAAPRAVDDLVRCASEAAEAVAAVTRDAAVLELVPVEHEDRDRPTYQLQIRRNGSDAPPSDLGVYQVAAAGYPVLRWYSREKWASNPTAPAQLYKNSSELEGNFKWMLSQPESRLVVLVAFFQQQPAANTGPIAE